MRPTDETNLADSGIDIVASPPGKKLQNVLLLSGGEKALAAVALLMAIFRYQPSPFCILDEVDAPLDEANIARLTRLLREVSPETQFIVITHSKKTMEAAAAMYGVPMQEPGVSKPYFWHMIRSPYGVLLLAWTGALAGLFVSERKGDAVNLLLLSIPVAVLSIAAAVLAYRSARIVKQVELSLQPKVFDLVRLRAH